MGPVADHQPAAAFVALGAELRDVGVDLTPATPSASIRRAPSPTMSSITDVDSPNSMLPEPISSAAGSGTTVNMGRTFPTSVWRAGLA
jgi:hypothetical protein